ncbi:MAG: hypothetical protein R3F37_07900 [Candidatus Competibacteraceae bacterium]
MPDTPSKAEQRQLARKHTTELIAILQGKEAAASPQQPRPPARPAQASPVQHPPPAAAPAQPTLPAAPPQMPNPLKGVGNTMQQSGSPLNKLSVQKPFIWPLNNVFIALLPGYLRAHATLARLMNKAGWCNRFSSMGYGAYASPRLICAIRYNSCWALKSRVPGFA